MQKWILFFLFFWLSLVAIAQTDEKSRCGTPEKPFLYWQMVNDALKKHTPQAFRVEDEPIKIPVIVHIIYNGEPLGEGANISAAQVQAQIEVINEDFRRQNADSKQTPSIFLPVAGALNIEFVLATVDTFGLPLAEKGINRVRGAQTTYSIDEFEQNIKNQTIWKPTHYLNIWTTNLRAFLGYAQFPDFSNLDGLENLYENALTDGIVIDFDKFGSLRKVNTQALTNADKRYNLGRTLTHELGHFLGLLHIWGDRSDCLGDDFCSDTPTTSAGNRGCNQKQNNCQTINMVQNFLDYSDDSCMNLFTKQQAQRMETVLRNSPRRRELTVSQAAEIVKNGVYAYFEAEQSRACPSAAVRFSEMAVRVGNPQNISFQWFFEGATPATSSLAAPEVRYEKTGFYDVMLVVRSDLNVDTLIRKKYMFVMPPLQQGNEIVQDFNNNDIENWTINGLWERKSLTANNFAMATRFNENTTAQANILQTPALTIGETALVEISFDLAYALNSQSSDSLTIMMNDNCSPNFQTLWRNGNATLATAPPKNRFTPTEKDWRRIRFFVDVRRKNNVQFAFRATSLHSNGLYIDNINIRKIQNNETAKSAFLIERSFLLEGENTLLQEVSSGMATDFVWQTQGGDIQVNTNRNLWVQYKKEGVYDISLNSQSFVGGNVSSLQNAIKVIAGAQISNKNPILAPFLFENKSLHLEGFENFGLYEFLHAFDVSVENIESSNLEENIEFFVFEGNQNPEKIIFSTRVNVGTLRRNLSRGRSTRINLDVPLLSATRYWIGSNRNEKMNFLPIFSPKKAIYTLDYLKNNLKIYPNPAENEIFIEYSNTIDLKEIRFYNLLGQLVKKILNPEAKTKLWLTDVPRGLYVVEFVSGENVWNQKIIIDK